MGHAKVAHEVFHQNDVRLGVPMASGTKCRQKLPNFSIPIAWNGVVGGYHLPNVPYESRL